ncbi:MAG TPA: nuclear transport factor 2 family protein [Puia sp.]|nr:nuclear transport factor 2 family protein [Puia sp.]
MKSFLFATVTFVLAGFFVGLAPAAMAQSNADSSVEGRRTFTELLQKDSLLFDAAFHTCNRKELESVLTTDFAFYHDNGYDNRTTVETYDQFTGGVQKNFCGLQAPKMRRELIRAAVQVFRLSDKEVVQTGVQRFYLLTAGKADQLVEESKFSRTWQKTGGGWRMARELDFMVNGHPGDNAAAVGTAGADGTATGASAATGGRYQPEPYTPEPKDLYDTIVRMDSLYFDTYNSCKLDVMASMTSDSLEFYHDRGGLMTSKAAYLEAIKNNICGKVTRQLMPGSIEVYPIHNWGAVEIGYHRFHNNQENKEAGGITGRAAKFIVLWHYKGGRWQVERVVSLH